MNTEVDIHAARPWWKDAVVYQIYPRSFADTDADGMGDLPGIIDRLPYLRTLGVDAIWICPFYTSPMVDYGYDVVDHTAVDPIFGTDEDADALIAAVHAHGLRVLVDIVLSHTSDQHPWFLDAAASRTSPMRGTGQISVLPDDWQPGGKACRSGSPSSPVPSHS